MVIIGEDATASAPTMQYCQAYAVKNGVDPAQVFMDNDGSPWGRTLYFINNYAVSSFGIPWNAVLTGNSMEYVYSDTGGGDGSRDSILQGLYDIFGGK